MKQARHQRILELIEERPVETQEELAALLRESGYHVTQATISRDIRELKLRKIAYEGGRQKYAALTAGDAELSERIIRVFRDAVIKLDYSQNIVVIRTLNGMGMAVGFAIDSMESSDILGSIAGDDTVFCVARTHSQAAEFMQKLSRIISA